MMAPSMWLVDLPIRIHAGRSAVIFSRPSVMFSFSSVMIEAK